MGEARDGNDFHVQTVVNDAIALGPSSLPLLPENHPVRNDRRWYVLGTLMENPWFSRAWVLQEAALANDPIVLYGRAEFGYRNLVTVVRYLRASTWAIKFRLPAFLIHIEWADWRVHVPAYSFVDLLSHGALLSCSDPRDKVYAFLGHPLAYPLTGTNLVRPDYRKTPAQVYLELSKALIQRTGIRVLTTVEHNQATILEDFPSWVTRWNVSLVMNDIYRVPNVRFCASAGLTASSSAFIAGNNLILQGVILDKVRQSSLIDISQVSSISFESFPTGERIRIDKVFEELRKVDGSPCMYSDRVHAFCMTLCSGRGVFGSDLARLAACLATMVENGGRPVKKTFTPQEENDALVYLAEVEGICMNRTFVVTERGFYGLAPLLTRPGDVACVLVGVDVPLVLRPHGEVGLFKLLGESYIHGAMAGQVKGMVERKQVFEQSLIIC
jgi:hypothetical protein